jgi:predicted transcriptional regulator
VARLHPDIPPLRELESEVMEEVWRQGECTVRSVMEALNRGGDRERAYTTFMTTMSRLADKGLLRRRRDGKADVYSPAFSRGDYVEVRAQVEVGALVETYGDAALVHFARHMAGLDPKRREQLRRLARRD